MSTSSSVECPHCHWGFDPSVLKQHIREKHPDQQEPDCGMHRPGDGSWWENDAQGIPLARVCEKCVDAKLAGYRPKILTGYTQADVDEPIEPEDY
jgi:hypothetical protein